MQWKLTPPTLLLVLKKEKSVRGKDCVSSVGNMGISPETVRSRCQLLDPTRSTPRLASEEVPTLRQPTVLPDALGVAAASAEEAREKARPGDKSLPGTYPTPDLRRLMDCFSD